MNYRKPGPLKGAWKLLEMRVIKNKISYVETNLYTRKAADVIKSKKDNKKYIRGQWCLDYDNPQLIEQTQDYDFVYTQTKTNNDLTEKDYLRELFVSSLFK